jgi:predicted patatin/cPLA2 family phospholipase
MKRTQEPEDYDFGFSFVDEDYEEVKEVNTKLNKDYSDSQQKIDDLQTRLETLYNAIVPFLDNLCKNPEKSTILWPNRVEKIQNYKKKLETIVKG